MLFDTHAHLNDDAYLEDLEDTIARAKEAGVKLINIRYGQLHLKWHPHRFHLALHPAYQSFHGARPLHDEILYSYPIYFTTKAPFKQEITQGLTKKKALV